MAEFERKRVGKALFQKPARLEVGLWIVALPEGQFFSLSQLYREVPSCQTSEIHACLMTFIELGMLERLTAVPNRPYYRRADSPLWRGFVGFAAAFESLENSEMARASQR